MSWIHLNFLRRSGAFHVGTARWSWLCALVAPSESIETWVWLSNQNSSGTVRSAYSGEFSVFAHHDALTKSSRPCSMVAVLLVCEYICKKNSAAWVFALVPDYAPRSWRIKCMCMHCESKCIRASQNDSKKKTCIANIIHIYIPHQNRLLTDSHRHWRRFSNPSIHSDMIIRAQVVFEH